MIEEKVAEPGARDPVEVDLLAVEDELRAAFAAAEREELTVALARLDVDVRRSSSMESP